VHWDTKPEQDEKCLRLTLTYKSADNEEGYPGKLDVKVIYELYKDENEVHIKYWAKSDKDTIINLTNHSFFNLEGLKSNTESCLDHHLWINAR